MLLLQAVLFYAGLCYATFAAYLAVTSLWAAKQAHRLNRPLLVLGWPLVIVGGLLDAALNIASSAPFLDVPREVFLTQRCGRYIAGPDGWRRRLALWICRTLLDPFQVGGHCNGSE